MLLVPCFSCYTAIRVMDEHDKLIYLVGAASEFWPDKYTCPACGRSCKGMDENEVELAVFSRLKIRELDADQMYAAQNGLGTPDEMICDASTVREILTQPIKKIVGENARGTTRFCLDHIEMESGVKVYFGASPLGAIVYKITRPIAYATRILREGDE